jgi:hypothetical protein
MAHEQPFVLPGTPGSVGVREVKGRRFYYRQFYDAEGKKGAEYIGPVGVPGAEEKAATVRGAISLAHSLVKEGRLLGQAGYVRADRRAVAVLGAFANHALFAAESITPSGGSRSSLRGGRAIAQQVARGRRGATLVEPVRRPLERSERAMRGFDRYRHWTRPFFERARLLNELACLFRNLLPTRSERAPSQSSLEDLEVLRAEQSSNLEDLSL